jgi:hypothetical protein
VGIDIFRSAAISGRRPIITNSVIPIVRPPRARGSKLSFIVVNSKGD